MKTITNDALTTYLENVKQRIYTNKIDSVLNLPSQFRWFAKKLLTDDENEVAKIAGIRKNAPQLYIPFYAEIAEKAVKQMAYHNADFGRFKSYHYGNNVLPESVRIRHESGERYDKKFTSTDLYSDYFFSMSDKNNFEFLIKTGEKEKLKKITLFELKPFIKSYTDSFIFDNPLFKKLQFQFNEKQFSISWNKYEYHINDREVFQSDAANRQTILKIIKAFNVRKRSAKKQEKFNSINLSEITVTIQDSINAGNCERGTKEFANKYFKRELEENIPITAEMIIRKQDDEYTRRAILKAAKI